MARKETGLQFLARLGTRPSLAGLEPLLFDQGPYSKDVIELYGPEGSGKTEMLLHLIVRCVVPDTWNGISLNGCNARVVVIDTDYKFSILRLASLIESFITSKISMTTQTLASERSSDMPADVGPGVQTDPRVIETCVTECLEKVHILRCSSNVQLVITLRNIEKIVCNMPDIAAIMIDSISAFYWMDRCNGSDSIPTQEANMKLACDILSQLINSYNLTVFATKVNVFLKKVKDSAIERCDKSVGYDDTVGLEDLEDSHVEFMCKAWQKLVTHRIVMKQVTSNCEMILKDKQTFMLGGSCPSRHFSVTALGVSII